MADVAVLNTSADISGKTLLTAENDRTVAGLLTFSRGVGAAPFAVGASAAAVANLDADLLDGQHGAYYKDASNLNAGTVPVARVPTVLTTTSVGTQNDFNPGALTGEVVLLRCSNATDLTISGIVAGTDGQILIVASVAAGNVFLKHQNSSSVAANRFINFATSCDTPLAAGVAIYVYDGTTTRWRLVQHDQGAFLARTYSSGDYTTNGAGGWTVESGDVVTNRYRLCGRQVQWEIRLDTTSVIAAVGTELRIAVPLGTPTAGYGSSYALADAGTFSVGFFLLDASATYSKFYTQTGGNWTASSNTTRIFAYIAYEVT